MFGKLSEGLNNFGNSVNQGLHQPGQQQGDMQVQGGMQTQGGMQQGGMQQGGMQQGGMHMQVSYSQTGSPNMMQQQGMMHQQPGMMMGQQQPMMTGGGDCSETDCKYFMKSGFCGMGHYLSCRETGCNEFMNHVPPNHIHSNQAGGIMMQQQHPNMMMMQQQGPTHQCPQGHPLMPWMGDSWYCNKCSCRGPNSFACRGCDYDLCPMCYNKCSVTMTQMPMQQQQPMMMGNEKCDQTGCKYFMETGHCGMGHWMSCKQVGCSEFMNTVAPNHIHDN